MKTLASMVVAFFAVGLVVTATPAQALPDNVAADLRQGLTLLRAGKMAAAIASYESALTAAPDLYGKLDRRSAQVFHNLAVAYEAVGKFDKAETMYARGLAIRETVLPPNDPNLAWSCHMLGMLYRTTGKYDKSEALLKRGLEIRRQIAGGQEPTISQSLLCLSGLYDMMGDYAKAERAIREALERSVRQRGADDFFVGEVQVGYGALMHSMGKLAEAETKTKEGLRIYEMHHGPNSSDLALPLNNLGVLYQETNRHTEAEKIHQRCLDIRRRHLPPSHPDIGQSLTNLGMTYKAMDAIDRAEPCFQQALTIFETSLGKEHALTAQAINNLGLIYLAASRFDEAEGLFQRSLAISEKLLPPDHVDLAVRLHNLCICNLVAGRAERAIAAADRQRRLVRRQVSRVLPLLSEREQLAFLRVQDEPRLHVALTAPFYFPDQRQAVEASASWCLNAKAIAQQTLAERLLLARQQDDATIHQALRELLAVRKELGRLTFAPPKAGQEALVRRQFEQLSAKEHDLTRQVQQSGDRLVGSDRWLEIDEFRRQMPVDAVFVDFMRVAARNFNKKFAAKGYSVDRYAAWIVTRAGPVTFVDLGNAAPIDAAVTAVRRALEQSRAVIGDKGEPAADKQLRAAMTELARLVLNPLRDHLERHRQWLLSPDGNLWLIPWPAMPWSDHALVIDNHVVGTFVSGRDLMKSPARADIKATAPVVFADPDFDLTEGDAIRGDGSRSVSKGLNLGRIARLPATAIEAEGVLPRLESYARVKPQLFIDRDASTSAFGKLKSPRALMLATHGFFLAKQEIDPAERQRRERDGDQSSKGAGDVEDPLLRCGLLLAGCNRRNATDTGIVTGREIVSADLRGCELVVLSACDTGLGDVRNGEGVAGLRQAFQLAGAESVVASLWQVPDRDTALLMVSFFDNLAKGMSKAEALREAQLGRIADRRKRFGAAHPYFWAAFTVTGR
jgi:CHAT domain-containing protein/Tfp pilus assembly protein PilF